MENKVYFALMFSVISVSFAAIFIVSIDSPALTIAFYRLLFTTLLIFPFLVFYKKTRDELKNLSRRNFFFMIVIGIVLAAHFALWITSLRYTSIASSVILVTAHPILVGPISHFFYNEKLSRINSVGITISLAGVVILVLGNYGLGSFTLDTLEGNILAILGGIAAGLYILGGRKIRKSVSIATYAFIVYFFGTLTMLGICLFINSPITDIGQRNLQIIFLMAIVSGIFGHTLYNWSLRHIRASVASVALLGEPLGSTILAFIIPWLNQKPSVYTIYGGTIILVGIYLTARKTNL